MPQVSGRLFRCHRLHGVADGDPLVERGEHAELHAGPQLRLAGQHDGQRGGRVEVGVGEHPDRLQLVVGQQVRLVDQQYRDPAPLCGLGGQRGGGLRDEGGVVEAGYPAERGDHGVVDAPRADLGLGR
jgi:hypothetical protein